MDKLIVHGGHLLEGTVYVSGSKNSSLPILAATLLTRDKCVIRRVPDLSDTNYMVQILASLGAQVERASGMVTVEADSIRSEAPYDLVRKMRASVCVMGPLLARTGECLVSLPGGCVIGDRPVDLHLRGFEQLGAEVKVSGGNIHVKASRDSGDREVNMLGKHGSTVLGTDNVLMAAVLTKGTTVIEGAATEPEVVDLTEFLIKMGAKIEGVGTRTLVVEGVRELQGAEHTVIPDRIEAGTFLVAGAIAGRRVTLKQADAQHMQGFIDILVQCGYPVEISAGGDITISRIENPRVGEIRTEPYPGFPTDMQAQFTALLATVPGLSTITETIFPQRFMHVPELARMGANISMEGPTAIIRGTERLGGAPVMASDLRASAALVLAGLMAEGSTEVNRLYHIDRGYEHIDHKLGMLGARMERVKVTG
ncbi:MAG: UDP-N-acetylglucosamine 1-carboxyvinyltransferase [Verrucomicrobiaceae bacterium]|nr:MAG: UDP-N-acetylglucosamine 1-carboxyvinyltransferase [Verrucomicrobiaceae bacterium]